MSFDGHVDPSGAGKQGAIPSLYPTLNPLQLEQFLPEWDYKLIKLFSNVYILPFISMKGDPAQTCFGAGLARLMVRNLMLLRDVSIHGPEDTPETPYESIDEVGRWRAQASYVTGIARVTAEGYSLQVELHRAEHPIQMAWIDQPDFHEFIFECSVEIAGLLESKVTDGIRQAWKIGQPRDAQSLTRLGRIQLGFPREKMAERAAAARQLLGVDPNLSVAAWEIDEEVPGAQRDFLVGLQRDPFNAQLCFHMFLTLWKSKGPQPEALQYCRRAIELSPGHGKAHMCAPHAAQRPVGMLNHSELGYRLLPGNSFAVNNYVIALDRAGAPASRRIELAREGIAGSPRDTGNYDRLIELYVSVGDPASALATAEKLQKLFEPTMDPRALTCLRQNPVRAKQLDSGEYNPAAENRQRIANLRQMVKAAPPPKAPQVRCPYCHKYIDKSAYPAHSKEHHKLRPDGQLTTYATLPEEERHQGGLDGVPKWYVHRKCGKVTGMPHDIIRSYLKDPFMYSGDTYCTGCRTHVPEHECFWSETGENLHTYKEKLRATKVFVVPPTPAPAASPVAPPAVAHIVCACGTRLPVNAVFCGKCGQPVKRGGAAPPSRPR